MLNILFQERFFSQESMIDEFKRNLKLEFNVYEVSSKDLIKENINVIFTRLSTTIDKNFIRNYPSLKHIVTPTTGLTHIDLDYCLRKDIKVTSLKDYTSNLEHFTGTSELALTLMLSLNLRMYEIIKSTCEGEWDRNKFMSYQLNKKTLGIIGYGRLGKILSKYAYSMGMTIIVYEPKKLISSSWVRQVDLQYLLKCSDYISIHASYSRLENYHLIDTEEIDLIKKECIFVNTARGELVNLKYLIVKLKRKEIRGIGIDTIEAEPNIDKNILSLQNEHNIIFTPHIGGCKYESTKEAERLVLNLFIDSL